MWKNLLCILGLHNWRFIRYDSNYTNPKDKKNHEVFRCNNCRDYKIKTYKVE
jgi:hypothetical protein